MHSSCVGREVVVFAQESAEGLVTNSCSYYRPQGAEPDAVAIGLGTPSIPPEQLAHAANPPPETSPPYIYGGAAGLVLLMILLAAVVIVIRRRGGGRFSMS